MNHLLFSNRKYTLTYSLFWLFVTVNHFFFDIQVFNASEQLGIFDAIWSGITFYAIGLVLWLVLKYSPIEHLDFTTLLFNHVATLALILVVWMSLVYVGIINIENDGREFRALFEKSFFWRILLGTIYYTLIVLAYYAYRYYNNYLNRVSNEMVSAQMAQQAKLTQLRTQMNPHFLFNSLNSISSLTIDEPAKAREMINYLSDFLRLSLKEKNSLYSTLNSEMEFIDNYLKIEEVRFGSRLIVSKRIEEACLMMKLPTLILQPLLENAIKHGVSERLEPTKIEIEARDLNQLLYIKISNEYDSKSIPHKGYGIGLENVKQRLKVSYKRENLLIFEKTDHIFNVILRCPQYGS